MIQIFKQPVAIQEHEIEPPELMSNSELLNKYAASAQLLQLSEGAICVAYTQSMFMYRKEIEKRLKEVGYGA